MLRLMLHVICEKHLINILNCEYNIMLLNNNNAAIFDAVIYKIILF